MSCEGSAMGHTPEILNDPEVLAPQWFTLALCGGVPSGERYEPSSHRSESPASYQTLASYHTDGRATRHTARVSSQRLHRSSLACPVLLCNRHDHLGRSRRRLSAGDGRPQEQAAFSRQRSPESPPRGSLCFRILPTRHSCPWALGGRMRLMSIMNQL